jgi:hypothetical protein
MSGELYYAETNGNTGNEKAQVAFKAMTGGEFIHHEGHEGCGLCPDLRVERALA